MIIIYHHIVLGIMVKFGYIRANRCKSSIFGQNSSHIPYFYYIYQSHSHMPLAVLAPLLILLGCLLVPTWLVVSFLWFRFQESCRFQCFLDYRPPNHTSNSQVCLPNIPNFPWFLVATLESPSVCCSKFLEWTTFPSIFHPFSPCFSPKSPEKITQAADDLQGEAFGAKVTPWLLVPADEVRRTLGFFMVKKGGNGWENHGDHWWIIDGIDYCIPIKVPQNAWENLGRFFGTSTGSVVDKTWLRVATGT